MDTAPDIAAGWYDDPAGGGALRWWDGGAWTEHVHEVQPSPAPSAVPASVPVPAPTALPALPTEASDGVIHVVQPRFTERPPLSRRIGDAVNWWLTPQRQVSSDDWRAAETSFVFALAGWSHLSMLVFATGTAIGLVFAPVGLLLAWRNRYPGGFVFSGIGLLIAGAAGWNLVHKIMEATGAA